MKSNRSKSLFPTRASDSPLQEWWQTAWRLWETALASPQVVLHGAARMPASGPFPLPPDRPEFERVGRDRLAAAVQAWNAMALQAYTYNVNFAMSATRQWWAIWTMLPLTFLPAPDRVLPESTAPRPLGRACWRVIDGGLAPGHRRVAANARRFARPKRD